MRTLRDLAAPWNQADVSRITGVPEPSLSRLWDDPDWLDHVKGTTLRALTAGVPGVATYFVPASLQERQSPIIEAAEAAGLMLDQEVYKIVGAVVSEQLLLSAIETAVAVVSGDIQRATHLLATLWCLDEDAALVTAFAPPDRDGILPPGRGLFIDVTPLILAAHEMRAVLVSRTNSFRAMLAMSVLSHHLGRVSELDRFEGNGSRARARHIALARRSEIMGRVVETNDVDLVDGYMAELKRDRVLAQVEQWAMPAQARDLQADQTLFVPERCSLDRTSSTILEHLNAYSDSYTYYLCCLAIPQVLGRDRGFGGRLDQLRLILGQRAESITDTRTRRAAVALLDRLPAGASHV